MQHTFFAQWKMRRGVDPFIGYSWCECLWFVCDASLLSLILQTRWSPEKTTDCYGWKNYGGKTDEKWNWHSKGKIPVILLWLVCSYFPVSTKDWNIPSNLWYKLHLSRYRWSSACQRCSNYIFILNLTHGFNRLHKYNCKTRQETSKFWNVVYLILEVWWYYGFLILTPTILCCT